MANSILTPTVITKESLVVLHQKANFLGNIHRGYDDSFGVDGGKIGRSLKIRQPNEFEVVDGATLGSQDVIERSDTLTIDAQKHVPFSFDTQELSLDIDEFSARYVDPAVSALVSKVESLVLAARILDVPNFYDGVGAAVDMQEVTQAGKILTDNLAPSAQRCYLHSTTSNADLIDNLKGLFNDQGQLKRQYKEGQLGRIGGFDHFENTHMPRHTMGTSAEGDTGWNINNASTEVASAAEVAAGIQTLTVDTGTTTLVAGDIITIENVYAVHPESKVSTGALKQFVVIGDDTAGDPLEAGGTALQISPPIIASGGRQNVDAAAADNAAINKVGGGNATTMEQNLAFHKDAFAFGTANLVMPDGVDFKAQEQLDGVGLRVIRQYTIANDSFPCRIDIMYGSVTQRPTTACRIGHNS